MTACPQRTDELVATLEAENALLRKDNEELRVKARDQGLIAVYHALRLAIHTETALDPLRDVWRGNSYDIGLIELYLPDLHERLTAEFKARAEAIKKGKGAEDGR